MLTSHKKGHLNTGLVCRVHYQNVLSYGPLIKNFKIRNDLLDASTVKVVSYMAY